MFRYLFYITALVLLILLPVLSFDFGITWDEPDQNEYGKKVVSYFLSGGHDRSCLNYKNLFLYGGLFDTVAAGVINGFSFSKEYEVRHFLNALTGFIAILYTGLTAREIGGWRAGFLAIIFIFLSPRFLGHAMNNPKDIPFAAGYIFTLYYLILFIKQLPLPSRSVLFLLSFGIAVTIGIRIGGVLLIFYFFMFSSLAWIKGYFCSKNSSKEYNFFVFSKYIMLVSITGYLLGIAAWPFGHIAPIDNPLFALRKMMNFTTYNGYLLFEGNHILTTKLPWYYIPKMIAVTTPLLVWAGLLSGLILINRITKSYQNHLLLIVIFATLFPLIYAIFNRSIVYDDWRHFLFIWPPLVVLSALSWNLLLSSVKKRRVVGIIWIFMALLGAKPLFWIIKNHPHEYVYFNELTGGIDKAFANYETDYWGNSIRMAVEWILEQKKSGNIKKEIVIRAYNGHPVSTSYYLKGKKGYGFNPDSKSPDWDYMIIISRFINREKLLHAWPPPGTVHTIKADNTVLCAVVQKLALADPKPVPKQ